MSAETHAVVNEQNPWPGLDAFDEAAERFFNGREDEAAALRRIVQNAALSVLFSASGLGKTSLIQAGLFPLLRRDNFLPVRVRLDFRDRGAPLVDQLKVELQKQISVLRIDAPPLSGDQTLWQYLHRDGVELWSAQNRLLTPVFVLDQFEEVFTLGGENASAVHCLLMDLADLVENRVPAALAQELKKEEVKGADISFDSQHYRVLLSFREDFLPAVEGWKRQMPSILRNRLRLLPMSGDRAFKAVHETAPHLVDEELAWQIVRFVSDAQEDRDQHADGMPNADEGVAVEPALLSLVCEGLNKKRQLQKKAKFDADLLKGTGQAIVADFYERSLADLSPNIHRFIENELITERGFRKPCDVDDALTVHGVTMGQLRLLESRRLLRIEAQNGRDRVELVHDLLTSVVREEREHRREIDRVERRRQEQKRKQRALLTFIAITLLAILSAAGGLVLFYETKARRSEVKLREQAQEGAFQARLRSERLSNLARAVSLRQEGVARIRERRYPKALESFRSALQLERDENAPKADQLSILLDIGDLLALVGNLREAEGTYDEAQQIQPQIGDPALEGRILESLAALKGRQNSLPQAVKAYTDANRFYQLAGDYQASGRVLEQLAFGAEKSRDLKRAGVFYQDALKSYTIAGDAYGMHRAQQGSERVVVVWGSIVDLLGGKTQELEKDTVNIGRNVEGVRNDISFSDRFVSRHHLTLSRDLHAEDLRSRNGTTINAKLLPYGIGAKLSDGDIIVLANVQPLQFRLKKPSSPPEIPKDAWAIFIDGDARTVYYLTAPEYSLGIEKSKVVLQPGSSDVALLRVRKGADKPEMMVTSSDWKMIFTLKETDYEYKTYIAHPGEWSEPLDIPLSFVKPAPDGKNIEDGPPFQIVFLKPLP
jgi:tetratricopeptide (TPR) repeat protein